MRGFQPQHFADGGLVQGLKRVFGMDEERNARVAAYRAQQAQEKAQQQAAAAPAQAPAPQRAITEYAGDSAMKRREKAAGLADGGMVRGPGTGTSDDVPDEVPEGTYIMPADSTQALGPDQLAAMGARGFSPGGKQPGKKVPVNLSNGEFKMPPEQVHAIGVQALDQMKNATHRPVRGFAPKAQPEEPRQFFTNGGAVKRLYLADAGLVTKQRLEEEGRIPGLAVDTSPQNAGRFARVPAPIGTQPDRTPEPATPGAPLSVPQPAAQTDPAKVPLGQMHSIGARSGAQMVADGARSGAQSFFDSFQKAPEPAAVPSAVAPAGMPGYKTDVQRGGGNVPAIDTAAPTTAPPDTAPPAPAAATTPREVVPGVFNHGRGQYSDNASGMGLTSVPGSGGQGSPVGKTVEQAQREGLVGERVGYNPAYDQRLNGATGISAQNMAAADALAGRSQQESMNRVTARGFPAAGGGPGSGPVEPGSFTGGYSGVIGSTSTYGNMRGRSPEQQRRDAEVSAGSIHGPTAAAGKAALAALNGMDLQGARSAGELAVANVNQQGGIVREGMQQAGATTRTGMTEQGANSREAGRNALMRDEFGLKKEAAGFQTRAAQQQEQLRNTLMDPKATPEQRKQAQELLQQLAGKEPSPQYKSHVMPAIRNADGSTTEGGVYQENTRTGEGRWVKPQGDGQAQQGALPKVATPQDLAALKSGTRFVDSNGVERIKK